ncbi:MAG TPA: TonB-dependent receptor [Longimicrobiales bacterium]|nr:TonB-dependent receptor [Longimicrobiales bacterium]
MTSGRSAAFAMCAFALTIGALAATPLGGQTATAALTGAARDASSRPVRDAEVRARSLESGFEYQVLSDAGGRYWLRALPPGRYVITAMAPGLRTAAAREVMLPVGATVRLDLTLQPSVIELAPLTVRVDLEDDASPKISYFLDRRQIERLPEESRRFIELAQRVPGASAGTDATGGPAPFGGQGATVGALNRQSLGVLVDGGDFTEAVLGDLGGSLPLLAIREFEVVQGQYGPELGRAASGVVNVVTRRGSNDVQAEGFGLYRHHTLNARGVFEASKPDFNRTHWGLAIGGPIARDRTHFFAAIERRVENEFSTVNTDGAFPEVEGTFRTPLIDNLFFARIDHRASDAHELTFRYAGEAGEQLIGVGGRRALDNGQNNALGMHGGLLAHRWSLPGGWLNEARLHVIGTRRSVERNAPPGPNLVYPSLVAGPHVERARFAGLRVELLNDLSWTAAGRSGVHRLKVGAHLGWQRNKVRSNNFENGRFDFATDTSSLPSRAFVSFEEAGIRLDARNVQLAVYARDDWTPTPTLTLSLGFRYDIETNGSNQGFVSPFVGELPFIPATPRPIDANNLAPRLGLAWDPGGDGGTVVRGGFGVFYDALVAGPLLAFERSSGVRVASIPDPGTTDVGELLVDPDTLPAMVWAAGERIETPMTRQFSVGVRHALPGGFVARVDGLLVQGRDLLIQRNLNPLADPDVVSERRFPGFADVRQILSGGSAEAKMLLLLVSKRFSRGRLDVGYTLADRKNTNDTWSGLVPQTDLDGPDLDAEWGPAAWDERHRVVATGALELPPGLGLVASVTYASARPFTAVTGRDDNGDGARFNDRPPGEGRNAHRGPDFFRADLGIAAGRLRVGPGRIGFELNVYNLFNTTNGDPASVGNIVGSALFGRPRAAFPKRQVEVGVRVSTR